VSDGADSWAVRFSLFGLLARPKPDSLKSTSLFTSLFSFQRTDSSRAFLRREAPSYTRGRRSVKRHPRPILSDRAIPRQTPWGPFLAGAGL
jgi:hypothetical protein